MKRAIGVTVAMLILLSTAAGCNRTNNNSTSSSRPSTSQSTSLDTGNNNNDGSIEDSTSGILAPDIEDQKLQEAYNVIRDEFGQDYLPGVPITETTLRDVYGVDFDLVEDYFAEGGITDGNVDTFIGIKAKEGEVDTIADALDLKRDQLITENEAHMMIYALKSARVVQYDNYIFYISLSGLEWPTKEEDQEQYADKEVARAVAALEGVLQ